MWSRFLAESRLAMRRPTPVIFAAQKQAQSLARPSGCHRASESVASCQAPQPGSDSADWTAWEIGSCHFLAARRASFVPGGLCVSRQGICRCVAALSPSSPLGWFETTKQELSALSVKGWLSRSERVGMQPGNLAFQPMRGNPWSRRRPVSNSSPTFGPRGSLDAV